MKIAPSLRTRTACVVVTLRVLSLSSLEGGIEMVSAWESIAIASCLLQCWLNDAEGNSGISQSK